MKENIKQSFSVIWKNITPLIYGENSSNYGRSTARRYAGKAMRHYDYTVNVTWVMGHYNTAKKYIESQSGPQEATGGSDWKKYMHPKYQRRIFFPELWTEEELRTWGENV